MTIAIPRSRQILSQCLIDGGLVKSINTCGVGAISGVIGTPMFPTPAISPASRSNIGCSGLSMAAAIVKTALSRAVRLSVVPFVRWHP